MVTSIVIKVCTIKCQSTSKEGRKVKSELQCMTNQANYYKMMIK